MRQAKVTMVDTEKKLESKLIKEISIIDSSNRTILLKKPNIIDQYRLVEIVGESAKNEIYMNMILPLLYVYSIDGIVCMMSKKSELEALISRLDETGIAEVFKAVQENFIPKSEEERKEKIKK